MEKYNLTMTHTISIWNQFIFLFSSGMNDIIQYLYEMNKVGLVCKTYIKGVDTIKIHLCLLLFTLHTDDCSQNIDLLFIHACFFKSTCISKEI